MLPLCLVSVVSSCATAVDVRETRGLVSRQRAACKLYRSGPHSADIAIRLVSPRLAFSGAQLREGVVVRYQLVVTKYIDQIIPRAVCGSVGKSGLYVYEIVEGNGPTWS
jgi:hypothetical protein